MANTPRPQKKHKPKYGLYILLAVVLIVSCSTGDNQSGNSITKWFTQPIADMNILELFFLMILANFIN
ncbi:hypothetical protein [Maribacter sp.]|uniref:hypothetical protein n=1 Tax=Maribacter sp. TaxID=1897614 RepID=UPI0025BF64C5|nr:hypothetical protein [Maribacter sp.]